MGTTMGEDRAHDVKPETRALTAKSALAVVSLGLLLGTGCAQKRVEVWRPEPFVQWNHLTTTPIAATPNGYRILPRIPTSGLFPASLGVTRVAIERTDDPVHPLRPYLTTNPRNEFLQWNAALDNQVAIGEVFPIVEHDLGGGDAVPEQILAAFHALRARLGLTYAVNELSETETEMFGVIYDTNSQCAIASLHAQAVSTVPSRVIDENKESIDLWETDSRALVRAKFENLLRQCVRELILRDNPATVVAPTGWTPAVPIRPVAWPPRRTPSTP